MKVIDIRRGLTKKISELGLQVRYEDINKVTRPCFFIDLIDYMKEFNTTYRELKRLDFDILYFPSSQQGNNTETWGKLEELDDLFEVMGNKILHVGDRYLKLTDVRLHIVDDIGHYEFSIELYDLYGKPIDYELMGELHLDLNKKESD